MVLDKIKTYNVKYCTVCKTRITYLNYILIYNNVYIWPIHQLELKVTLWEYIEWAKHNNCNIMKKRSTMYFLFTRMWDKKQIFQAWSKHTKGILLTILHQWSLQNKTKSKIIWKTGYLWRVYCFKYCFNIYKDFNFSLGRFFHLDISIKLKIHHNAWVLHNTSLINFSWLPTLGFEF